MLFCLTYKSWHIEIQTIDATKKYHLNIKFFSLRMGIVLFNIKTSLTPEYLQKEILLGIFTIHTVIMYPR